MSSISKEDYLKLLQEIAEEEDSEVEELGVPEDAWIWGESPAKDRIKKQSQLGVVDVTNCKKGQIKDALYKCTNIKVGNFLVRITKYHGYPDKLGRGTGLTMDVQIWEKRFKTPSGNPCNMDYPFDPLKDDRFFDRPWLSYFTGSSAHDVPVETVVEVVRWIQALKRMSAFL